MKLVGANTHAAVTGAEELPGKSNYFIGNDPRKWRTNVPNYAKVKYAGVYPGVDLVYYGNQGGQLEYDFVVAPGADPTAIRFALSGGEGRTAPQFKIQDSKFKIDADGDLVINTESGEVRFHKPVVYQTEGNHQSSIDNRQWLNGRYVLHANNQVGFQVAAYDHTQPLVIDPVLTYSTYLGGTSVDEAFGIAVDSTGAAYVAGLTESTNFPTKTPYQASIGSAENGFVTKLNPAGSALVYSTYVGGSSKDEFSAIALDSTNEAVLAGNTQSTDFPTLHPLSGGASYVGTPFEGVVVKLNAAGNGLVYSTYLGGAGSGQALSVGLDSSGDAFVGGYTSSTSYPVLHAIQATNAGGNDGTLSMLQWDNTTTTLSLVYSTFWGGSATDEVTAVAPDAFDNVYLAGSTASSNFPTHAPAYAFSGSLDGFVSKLHWNGTTLSTVYSTCIGGSTQVSSVVIDSGNHAYVTGSTGATGFPTVHPLQATYEAISNDNTAFVAEVNDAGSALVFSTFLGGTVDDGGTHIALGATGNVYVVGNTWSPNFPTANAFQTACDNCSLPSRWNAFVTALHWNGSALSALYSTFLGGSEISSASGIAVNPTTGDAYVTGYTTSTDFPTASPYQATNKGSYDAFVAKIPLPSGPGYTLSTNLLAFGNQEVGATSAKQSVTLTSSGASSLAISSIAASGDFALVNTGTSCLYTGGSVAKGNTCTIDVSFTPNAFGALTGAVTITSDSEGVANSKTTVDLAGTGEAPVVGLSPSSPSVALGGTQVFTATIANTTNTALHWYVNGVLNGNATQGTLTACTTVAPWKCTYTAPPVNVPSPNPAVIQVTSVADPSAFKTASVTVTDSIAVGLTPTSASLVLGGTQVFTATLSGSTNTALNWSVNGVLKGNSAEGTLTACTTAVPWKCTYTAPASAAPSPNPAVIAVASAADPAKNKTADVTVTAIAVTLTPSSASVALSGTQVFTATISGTTNTALTWSVNGVLNGSSTEGTISACTASAPWKCTYTAPAAAVPSPNPAVVEVASVAAPSKNKTANVTVTDSIAVGLSPATANVGLSGTQIFTATISGTTNTTLKWYVNGVLNGNSGQGTLTACTSASPWTCKYTAPSGAVPTPNPAVIEVASAADPGKTKTAALTVLPTSFVTTGGLTTGRYNHTATLLNNGKVLVVGGYNSGGTLTDAELYDPATGTFSATGSLHVARQKHTATLLPNGMVLIAGGCSTCAPSVNGTALASAELYNPANGTFTNTTGSMNTPRFSHTATLLNTGKVLLAVGYDTSILSSAELYDPSSQTFTNTGSLPANPVQFPTATLLNSGEVLIAGGYLSGAVPSANAWLYNPSGGTFSATGAQLQGCFYCSATLLPNGTVLLAGGSGTSGLVAATAAEVYTPPPTGTWAYTTNPLNDIALGASATLLASGPSSGMVLIAGGQNSSGTTLATAVLYNPSTQDFTATGSLHTARSFQTATVLQNGTVLMVGGYDNGTYLSSAEVY